MKALALATAVASLVLAFPVWAKTQNLSGNIKGTFDNGTAGSCSSGYANQCASGTCKHYQFTGNPPTGSGTIGKGTVISMCLTVDGGNSLTPADSDADDNQTCYPFFGNQVYEVTKSSFKVAVNLAGVFCHHQATSKTDLIQGGWGIDGAHSDDPTLTGWGTLTGTANSNGAFSLKISGSSTTGSP